MLAPKRTPDVIGLSCEPMGCSHPLRKAASPVPVTSCTQASYNATSTGAVTNSITSHSSRLQQHAGRSTGHATRRTVRRFRVRHRTSPPGIPNSSSAMVGAVARSAGKPRPERRKQSLSRGLTHATNPTSVSRPTATRSWVG